MIAPGSRLGDWVVDAPLGEGGMGAVYRCHSVLTEDVVAAVKVMKQSALGDAGQRFVREVRTLAALNHPCIVRVLGGGRDDAGGVVYMAMELIEGEDLSYRLARGAMDVDEASRVFGPIADALAYAHGQGVAHRDIKPGNIMLRPDGTPVIVDFGIAIADDLPRQTREGLFVGTLAYLPPEVFEGRPQDAKSTDAYALGVVIWEALTRKTPFPIDPDSNEREALARVAGLKLRSDPLDPGSRVPKPIRDVVLRTTDPEPASRLTDLLAVRDLLTTGQTGRRLPRRRRRVPRWALVAAAVPVAGAGLALLLALVVVIGWLATRPGPERLPVQLAATLDEAATALRTGDVAGARAHAGRALDDHPADPYANAMYGQVLLGGGELLLARPYLCAAADALGVAVPGVREGTLDCERGPGSPWPLTAPPSMAAVDLTEALTASGALAGALSEKASGQPDRAVPAAAPSPGPRAAGAPPVTTAGSKPTRPQVDDAPRPSREIFEAEPEAEPAPEPAGPTDVRIDAVVVTGDLDRDAAEAVILPSLRHCAATTPGARSGVVRVALTVAADGSVVAADVLQDDAGLGACASAALRRASFQAGGTVTVTLTWF